eukprot:2018243-Pyramimonas_sp.AAC.1
MPPELWERCRRETPGSFTFSVPCSCSAPVRLYASWASAVEPSISTHHGVAMPPGPRRAEGPRFKVTAVKMLGKARVAALRDQ